MSKQTRALRWLQYLVFGSLVLYFGKDVFVPISFAALISFVLYPSCAWMERKGLGRVSAIAFNLAGLSIVILGILFLLSSQFMAFVKEWPSLQAKLHIASKQLTDALVAAGISVEQQQKILTQAGDQSASNVMSFLNHALASSISSVVMLVLIPIYAILILYYRHLWVKVLHRLLPNEDSTEIDQILHLTIKTYHNFIKGMGIVYLAVGILNSVGLLILGIPHAILFGFIASVLTFIPYIGIMVGSLLPITMAWITYDSIWYPLGVVGVFTFVQYLEANIIFPFAVSSRLNVNTLVMLIAIFAGGVLWGVAGMILFVPMVGILKLIADHNPKLKTLSMALGTKS